MVPARQWLGLKFALHWTEGATATSHQLEDPMTVSVKKRMNSVNTLMAEPVWVVQLFKIVFCAIFCTEEVLFDHLDATLQVFN